MKKKKDELDVENLNEVINLSKKILKITFSILILAIVVITLYLCKDLKIFAIIWNVLKAASPFFIGVIIAWLLNPLVTWLQKKKVKRVIGAIFVFFLFLAVVYLFFRIMFPMLYKQINDFIELLPSLVGTIGDFIYDVLAKFSSKGIDISNFETELNTSLTDLAKNITTTLPTTLLNFVTTLVSSIGTVLIGLIVGFYLLIDFDGISNVLDFIPKRYHDTTKFITHKLNDSLRDFVQGTLLISLVIFVISSIAFRIVGLPSPMLFGLICGITNIIPYIGPWIGGGIATIVGFTVSPVVGILTAVVAFIIQQLDAMVLQPLIMGKTMKLHPVTIMIGLLIFGYFFGVIGMILATPIIAGIKILIQYFDDKYEITERIKQQAAEDTPKTTK